MFTQLCYVHRILQYSDKLINMFKPTELCLKPSCTYKNLRMGIVCRYFLHFCFVADPNPPGDELRIDYWDPDSNPTIGFSRNIHHKAKADHNTRAGQ